MTIFVLGEQFQPENALDYYDSGVEFDIIRFHFRASKTGCRTTLTLDDDLLAAAQALTGLNEKSALVREALKALIERESARRLARLGGSEPGVRAPRRRWPVR